MMRLCLPSMVLMCSISSFAYSTELEFLVEGDWPPFHFKDEKGKSVGISVGVIQTVAPKFSYTLKINRLGDSWKALDYEKLVEEAKVPDAPKATCNTAASPSWRENYNASLLWSEPVLKSNEWLVTAKSKTLADSLEKLPKGTKIAVCKGYFFPKLDVGFKNGALIRVDFEGDAIKACDLRALEALLSDSSLAAANVNEHVAGYYFKKKLLKKSDFKRSSIQTDSMGLQFPCAKNKAGEEFIKKVNAGISQFDSNGTIKRIVGQFTDPL